MPCSPGVETIQEELTRHKKEIADVRKQGASADHILAEGIREPTTKMRKFMHHTHVGSLAKRIRVQGSNLTINGDIRYFRSAMGFSDVLYRKGQAYFDNTRYISILNEIDDQILFFRPRRFGKSFAANMLEHFHGLQYTGVHHSAYKVCIHGLDVQTDIEKGRITPGQYFVLKFDFSNVNRSLNPNDADLYLKNGINRSFEDFYETYSMHPIEDMKKFINPDDPSDSLWKCVRWVNNAIPTIRESGDKTLADVQGIYLLIDEYDTFSNDYLEPYRNTWEGTAIEMTFRSFWTAVSSLAWRGIKKTFITGISPLTLSGVSSGYNMARNLSFHKDLAGLCGLTRTDIQSALEVVCGPNSDAYKKHLSAMTEHFNGYHFCKNEKVDTIYNTETCLAYLQALIDGGELELFDPPNSEVSDQFLRSFAASSSAISDFQQAIKHDGKGFALLPYDHLMQNFKLKDLNRDAGNSRPAWRSLMIYFGGLTPYSKDPAKYLKIPNKIAARRIAEAVLEEYGLLKSLKTALELFNSDGEIEPLLSCYRNMMAQRDVGHSDFSKSEEIHRDSFYFSLLQNQLLQPQLEFKSDKSTGRVDLLLHLHQHLIVTEWKVIRIDFLDIPVSSHRQPTPEAKASALNEYTLQQILQLKFNRRDHFRRGQTLERWIKQWIAPQLKDYIMSPEVKQLVEDEGLVMRAHLVVVVGSRHILLWDMNEDGNLVDEPNLVGQTG
ncbi:hypothetical protein GP486_001784 [Trichoglossum hirsutum]|uniref:CRIB domain-containing protein n=1 Tax=Trichoglossum hirsutum TaxID=265104 RepID=A0A9P8LG67_9PEZI|nr:hypothetical protein GP486_001784 [Trichoglossum hirsutum]